jgi:hypothetical protein
MFVSCCLLLLGIRLILIPLNTLGRYLSRGMYGTKKPTWQNRNGVKKITWRETECPRKSFGRGPTPWRRVGSQIGGIWGRPLALGVCSRQWRATACVSVRARAVGLQCVHDVQLTAETTTTLQYHLYLGVIGQFCVGWFICNLQSAYLIYPEPVYKINFNRNMKVINPLKHSHSVMYHYVQK